MIHHVKFVSVPTADQDRALSFWTEKVGLKVATDSPMGTQRWIELRIGAAETRLVLFTANGEEARIGSLFNGAFAADDVERTYRELSERGVEFEGPPKTQPWGTMAIFKDPDGNRFVLGSSR